MAKRGLIVLFIMFILISSVGCQQLGTDQKVKQKEKESAETVYKGTKGLSMSFVKNNPPKIIYTTTPLNMLIEIKNEGTSNIAGGRLFLSGIDPKIIRLDRQFQTFNVEGKSKYNPSGGINIIEFRSQAIYLPGGTDVYKPTILASACYEYQTQASPLVCIDPNPYSVLEKEACTVKNIPMTGGQGAPVAVTNIEEEAVPGKANFIIHVSNQGGGVVIDKSGYGMQNCPHNLRYEDLDTVYYKVTLSGASGDCRPINKIKLVNGKGTIFCSFSLPSGDAPAYQTVLNIELYYGYLSQISQQIEIRSIS